MKNYYETIRDTQSSLEENVLSVPKGTELILVPGAFGGTKHGYAVKDPVKLGACTHDSKYRYAYIDDKDVFAARLIRAPLTKKSDNWQDTANAWSIRIAGQVFDYYSGSAIDKSPTYDDVMCCLLGDAGALTQTFEEWAKELGYDTDSRKAYEVWEECGNNARKLHATGIDLEAEMIRLGDY